MDILNRKYKGVAGIYEIRNVISDQFYIGSTVDLYERSIAHRRHLRKGAHVNIYLQRAWLKHGESAFEFRILGIFTPSEARIVEQRFLDIWVGKGCCYNLARYVEHPLKGRKLSELHKARIGHANSIALKGKKLSDEHKRHLGESSRRAWAERPQEVSPETRQKMSDAKKGRKMPFNSYARSDETKRKISETKTGYRFTDEEWGTYKKLSLKLRIKYLRGRR